MKREWKKKLKSLEREKKKYDKQRKKLERRNKRWPAIFCQHENIFIGISLVPLEFKFGVLQKKVVETHWRPELCKYRLPRYVIDFKKYKEGEKVMCPWCGHPVDFRVWLSATVPEFVEVYKGEEQNDKENNSQKLSNP